MNFSVFKLRPPGPDKCWCLLSLVRATPVTELYTCSLVLFTISKFEHSKTYWQTNCFKYIIMKKSIKVTVIWLPCMHLDNSFLFDLSDFLQYVYRYQCCGVGAVEFLLTFLQSLSKLFLKQHVLFISLLLNLFFQFFFLILFNSDFIHRPVRNKIWYIDFHFSELKQF